MKEKETHKKPDFNQKAIKDFADLDVVSGGGYLCMLKKNNGEVHLFTNINSKEMIDSCEKEFSDIIKKWGKR